MASIPRRSTVTKRALRSRRKRRRGEHVCECRAYDFPHRFGGGSCRGIDVVAKQWDRGGWNKVCLRCHCREKSEAACQVLDGKENVDECPAWQSYVASHEIRVSLRRLRELARSRPLSLKAGA